MEQELQIYRSNNNAMTANSQCVIKIDAGIYDLEYSGVMLEAVFALAANNATFYRLDFCPGWSQCIILVDGEQRFLAQDLSSFQKLWYDCKAYQEAFMDQVVANEQQADFPMRLLLGTGIAADSNGVNANQARLYFPFKRFFPGFQEKYLVVKHDLQILLTLRSVTGSLISASDQAGGALTAKNVTSFSPVLLMKKVFIPNYQNDEISIIDCFSYLKASIDGQIFNIGANEVSNMSGLSLEDADQTAIQNGLVTPARLGTCQITKNDYDIVNGNTHQNILAQFNGLKRPQRNQNTFSFVLDHLHSNSSIKYFLSKTNADQLIITMFVQKVRKLIPAI